MSDAALAARDPRSRDDPARPYHQRWVWDGRALDDQDVLVRCYHGLGDTIQFARFLPALAARAKRVTLEVQPELLRLLAAQRWALRLRPFDPAHPLPPAGVDVEIMELCHALRLPPTPRPYLTASPLGPPGTGICWQAGGWDNARSIPPELLAPLLPPGTVSLQRGAVWPAWPPATGPAVDAWDTARRIAALDRVVSVDTMVAHLAAALGRPTYVLLKHEADWRWGQSSHVPWYGAANPLRQTAPGDWPSLLPAVASALLTGPKGHRPLAGPGQRPGLTAARPENPSATPDKPHPA